MLFNFDWWNHYRNAAHYTIEEIPILLTSLHISLIKWWLPGDEKNNWYLVLSSLILNFNCANVPKHNSKVECHSKIKGVKDLLWYTVTYWKRQENIVDVAIIAGLPSVAPGFNSWSRNYNLILLLYTIIISTYLYTHTILSEHTESPLLTDLSSRVTPTTSCVSRFLVQQISTIMNKQH